MKWPLVSRHAYDLVWDRCVAVQAKYDALLAEHLAYLKPKPPVVTTPNGKAAYVGAPERDAVKLLAMERGGRDAALRRHLLAYVEQQRAAGVNNEQIADALTNWTDPEDEG